jgi:VWFA-related protein
MRNFRSLLPAACALTLVATALAQDQPVFRTSVSVIPIYATVRTGSGAFVPDLTRDDFLITDNGVPREVVLFSREVLPITVTMMLDMSGSQELGGEWMRAAGRGFVEAMLPADRARIGSFGEEISISPRLTSDKTFLNRVLSEEIWPGGSTPLWDALDRAMTSLADQSGRRVVVVLTDGVDTSSNLHVLGTSRVGVVDASGKSALAVFEVPGSLLNRAIKGEFMLYAVGRHLPPQSGNRPPAVEALSSAIRNLAFDSGGGYRVFSSGDDAIAAGRQVVEELHHQYLLGFTPAVLDGKVHKLEVTTRRGGMFVQARKNYLAGVQ